MLINRASCGYFSFWLDDLISADSVILGWVIFKDKVITA